MLHAGLDLSRKKIDVCLLSPVREVVDEGLAAGRRRVAWAATRAGMWSGAVAWPDRVDE